MASSDVDICNRALDAIGAQTIGTLLDDTRAARLCNRYYPEVRDDVLRSHPWNCALKRASLNADATAPVFGYANRYLLPADCLRVIAVEGDVAPGVDWQIEAGAVVTNEPSPLRILYVYRVTDEATLDPMLVSAIAARLAMELAVPLTGSAQIRQQMASEFRERIRAARSADGQEGTPLRVGADDFVLSRL